MLVGRMPPKKKKSVLSQYKCNVFMGANTRLVDGVCSGHEEQGGETKLADYSELPLNLFFGVLNGRSHPGTKPGCNFILGSN